MWLQTAKRKACHFLARSGICLGSRTDASRSRASPVVLDVIQDSARRRNLARQIPRRSPGTSASCAEHTSGGWRLRGASLRKTHPFLSVGLTIHRLKCEFPCSRDPQPTSRAQRTTGLPVGGVVRAASRVDDEMESSPHGGPPEGRPRRELTANPAVS